MNKSELDKTLHRRYFSFKNQCFLVIATGLGIGYLPGAPGTYGTILAAFVYYFLLPDHLSLYLICLIISVVIGIVSAGKAEQIFGVKDSPHIVIDEILGFWLAMCGFPKRWGYVILGIIFFRLFDILKPFPIKRLESLSGGIGIVTDDLMAGLYTLIVLKLLTQIM
jgi:phosphatidylglycerophosphatase A